MVTCPNRNWNMVYGLGEFLWYISGDNSLEMISYYAPSYTRFSDDNKTLYGAYGPRIKNCYMSAIEKLKKDPDSRQSIILIWKENDLEIETKDLPCTVYLQLFIRENKLNMIANMRSNDIWLGTPNDIFCFTLLQELIASNLNLELGFYQHNAGSLHVYENTIQKISKNNIINSTSEPMNKIPDLYQNIDLLIEYELNLRNSKYPVYPEYNCSEELKDLMLLLYYYKLSLDSNEEIKRKIKYLLPNIKQNCMKNFIKTKEQL
jgi:thymidylate synthase